MGANGKFGNSGLNGMVLQFQHVPTGFKVEFPAFLELFSDQYTSHWNEEQVFGRMDPIATFSHTRRNLSIAWNVPADSFEDAQRNLSKMNELISFLYPLYDVKAKGGATAMNQGPLLRVKFGNLIQSVNGGGLLGWVNGFTFDPALEFGMFHKKPTFADPGADHKPSSSAVEYYPKTFRVNCELNVLHEHALGFSENSKPPGKTKGSSPKSSAKYSLRSDALDKSKFPYDIGNPPPSQRNLVGQWNSENEGRDAQTKAIRSANPAASNSRIAEAVNKSVLQSSGIPYKGDQGK
jgi:hypothetical protein